MALVTLALAKDHIYADWLTTSPADPRDAILQEFIDQASDHIMTFLKQTNTSPAYYDESSAPPRIRSMTLLLVGHLWEHRGDDMETSDAAVWEAIRRYGVTDQTPGLA